MINQGLLLAITVGLSVLLCGLVRSQGVEKSKLVSNLQAGKEQTVVAYGTSLTAGGAWVGQLSEQLNRQFPELATVVNSGESGMWSKWGLDNLNDRVINKKPDMVIIEFSINDAFIPYKTTVSQARTNLVTMIDRILAANKSCEIVLMVMNPPIKEHLKARPRIKAYNQMYRDVAKQRRVRLIDHNPSWQKILEADSFADYVPDGIHPNAEGCSAVITPGILSALGIEAERQDKRQSTSYRGNSNNVLVVINGESNSGGCASNSEALPRELGPRRSVKILNNISLASFDELNIGNNNLVGHFGIDVGTTHGFELELANRADNKQFYSKLCYLLKTGQGGSRIAEWDVEGDYYATFLKRVKGVKKLLSDKQYRTVILFSLGINDAIAGTDVNTWKEAVKAHFGNMRNELGINTPIIMTRFMPNFAAYNTAIEDICREVPNVYSVNTLDAPLSDAYHWNYIGMKLVTGRMLDILESLNIHITRQRK